VALVQLRVCLHRHHRRVRKPVRGGLVIKAHRWLYHSTLGSRVIKKLRVCLHRHHRRVRKPAHRYSSQFENNYFTEMCSGSEEGSYLRLIDGCITQL